MNFRMTLVGPGAIGLIASFVVTLLAAQRKIPFSGLGLLGLCLAFVLSLAMTIFGDKVTILSGLSSGLADD